MPISCSAASNDPKALCNIDFQSKLPWSYNHIVRKWLKERITFNPVVDVSIYFVVNMHFTFKHYEPNDFSSILFCYPVT